MKNCYNGATVDARIRELMFTKSRKRATRKVPTRTAKVPSWYIRPDGTKP